MFKWRLVAGISFGVSAFHSRKPHAHTINSAEINTGVDAAFPLFRICPLINRQSDVES